MTSLRIGSRALCPGAAAMRLATVVASVGTSRGVYEREMKRGRGRRGGGPEKALFCFPSLSLPRRRCWLVEFKSDGAPFSLCWLRREN